MLMQRRPGDCGFESYRAHAFYYPAVPISCMRGTHYLVLSGICLGTIGIFVKLIGPDISGFLLATIRILAAAGLIYAFLASERRLRLLELKRGDLRIFLIAGFFGVVMGFGFYVKALTLIPVANAVMLVYIYPVATAVLASMFLGESTGRYSLFALALAFAGTALIFGQELGMNAGLEGSLLALSAGLGYSVFIVSMRHMELKGHSYWDVVFWPLLLGGLMLTPLNLTERVSFLLFPDTALYLAGVVLISTFLAYAFYARGLGSVKARQAVLIENLVEPATAVLLAWLLLGESVSVLVLLGGLLIVLANLSVRKDIDDQSLKKRI
jgi:drug/metabolite transporter (DMT)-like permease